MVHSSISQDARFSFLEMEYPSVKQNYSRFFNGFKMNIYMWYGAECDDWDNIENFETLVNTISHGLLTSPGELYIHYKKSNKTTCINNSINRS